MDAPKWQSASGRRPCFHAFLPGEMHSACRRLAKRDDAPLLGEPDFGASCPACEQALAGKLSREACLNLPVNVLGRTLSVRGYHAILALNPEARTLADVAVMRESALRAIQWCGRKSIESIRDALAAFGLAMAEDESDRKKASTNETRRAEAQRAQAMRIIEAVGLEGVKELTLSEIGEKVGVSRERIRQIFLVNAGLAVLRGGGPGSIVMERVLKAKEMLLEGYSLDAAAEAAGISRGTLVDRVRRAPELAEAAAAGRIARKEQIRERHEAQVIEVADYAVANGCSLRKACQDLGFNYPTLVKLKNSIGAHLKDRPEYKDILDWGRVVQEEVETAKTEIASGVSITEVCKNSRVHFNTLVRHLSKDPTVTRVKKRRTEGAALQEGLEAAKKLVLGGSSYQAAARAVGLGYRTVVKHLSEDPELVRKRQSSQSEAS